jgi:hypothetical protein
MGAGELNTSAALENSTAGRIISGTIGGALRRAAGRRTASILRNRDIENQELQPLSSRTGEQLGGRRNINRIVDDEMQQTHDPQTGEI